MSHRATLRFATLAIFALAATGCGTSSFSGQVVSCSDLKPIPDAKLTYADADGREAPKGIRGEMPGVTAQDGTVKADILASKGTTYAMTIEKKGYVSKTVPLTSGADQNICLDPTKKE